MRLLPCGDRALLVEFESLEHTRAAHASWVSTVPPGVIELVPAARTVLARVDPAVMGLSALEQWLTAHAPSTTFVGGLHGTATVVVPTRYDGDDLDTVADVWGCSRDAVAARHSGVEWVCAFIGFAPGFAYLVPTVDSLPPMPRRSTSRPRVPAGAVALATEYCGIYPRESPGGWQLIGHTDLALWDADREAPALVTPGTRVRFEAVRE